MIRRPMLMWFIMCVISIGVTHVIKPGMLVICLSFLFSSIVVCMTTYLNKNLIKLLKIILFGLLLMLISSIYTNKLDNRHVNIPKNNNVTIEGMVIDVIRGENSDRLIVNTDEGKILVSVSENTKIEYDIVCENTEDILVGYTIKADGKAKGFLPATNLGQFDEYNYYYEQLQFDYKLSAKYINVMSTKQLIIDRVRCYLFENLDNLFAKEHQGILSAMLLGDSSRMSENDKEMFSKNGIMHLTVVSGTHISMLALMILSILKTIIGIRKGACISLVVAVFYTALAGFKVAATRALIMLLIMLVAIIIYRTYDSLSALGLSGIIILMLNPLRLFSVGFQLSFLAVIGIEVIYKPFHKMINQHNARKIENGEIVARRGISKFYNQVVDSIILSLSINLITLPIVVSAYYEYVWISPVINVIILPFIPFILVMSMILLILAGSFERAGIIGMLKSFASSVDNLLRLLSSFLDRTNNRIFRISIGKPSNSTIVVYYVALLVLIGTIYILHKKINLVYSRRKLIISALFIFSIAACFVLKRRDKYNSFVEILDVGQGLCCIVNYSDKDTGVSDTNSIYTYMFDCGSTDVNKVGKYRVIPYLKAMGIGEVDYLFVSHLDNDHISGIGELIADKDIVVNNIVVPFNQSCKFVEGLSEIIDISKIHLLEAKQGQTLELKGVSLKCLSPNPGVDYSDVNSACATYYVNFTSCEYSFLFAADVQEEGEVSINKLLRNNGISHINLLQVAHHGSMNSTKEEFLDGLRIDDAVISCGAENRYGHPHAQTLDRLRHTGCRIFRTDQNGSVRFNVD